MLIAKTIAGQMEHSSWIRRMFEEGTRLKRDRGAENVYDYTLGNPDVDRKDHQLVEHTERL